jgi:hypothetical protein
MPATGLKPHADLLTDFPYLGPPKPRPPGPVSSAPAT